MAAKSVEVNWGSVAPPYWSDKPVIVVGTGPSLKGFDFEQLRGLGYILAVKQAIYDLPFADACIGIDRGWMRREAAMLETLAQRIPVYLLLPIDDTPAKRDIVPRIPSAIYVIAKRASNWLSEKPTVIECGATSGFAAYNVAYVKRPPLIALFGYDFQAGGHYDNSRYRHFVGDPNAKYWARWGRYLNETAHQVNQAGIGVINAARDSAITAFPRMTPQDAVAYLRRWRATGER